MPFTKIYDEMADQYNYFGESSIVLNEKNGFGVVTVQPVFSDLKYGGEVGSGGDVFWIIFKRKAKDWYWLDMNDFIVLANNQRIFGKAIVRQTEVTEEQGFFETHIWCHEEVLCPTSKEDMTIMSEANTVKIRLGNVDMVLPETFLRDMKEMEKDVKETGGYGR